MKIWPGVIVAAAVGACLLSWPAVAKAQESSDACQAPTQAIVAENCLPGNPDWRPAEFSDEIQGYASATSVVAGDTLSFYVDTAAPSFDLTVFRVGYYQGAGARQVAQQSAVSGGPQPRCLDELATGLIRCDNWRPSLTVAVPDDWPTGVYLARFEAGSEANATVFVVRDDAAASDLLVQIPVTTYQAHNPYGGKSTLDASSGSCSVAESGNPRAVAVSFDRPYAQALDGPDGFLQNDVFWVQWLEAQGYGVSYATSLDVHAWGAPDAENGLLGHRAFLSIGHDAYWSQEMWTAVTAARDAGVSLGFFSASTARWRIRLEPSTRGDADRVLVVYKTVETGRIDPTGVPTSAWRDPTQYGLPENQLVGSYYTGGNAGLSFPLRLSGDMARDRIYRHTGLQALAPDATVAIGAELVGWEWNSVTDSPLNPIGLEILAESPVAGALLTDAGNDANARFGPAYAHMTRYVAASGALVFSAGTAQWGWGLEGREPNLVLRQITYNVLADMGVGPHTPAATLILDGSNIPDPVFTSSTPDIGLPTISNLSIEPELDGAVIRWQTAVPARGQVFLGETAEHIQLARPAESELTTQHRIVVKGLEPGTDYFAQVLSVAADGSLTFSNVRGFETQEPGPERVVAEWGQAQWVSLACLARPVSRPFSAALHDHPMLTGGALIVGSALVLAVGSIIVQLRRRPGRAGRRLRNEPGRYTPR